MKKTISQSVQRRQPVFTLFCFGIILMASGAYAQNFGLNLGNVPKPVIDDHPEWITLYNRTWELAKKNVRSGTASNGLVNQFIDEAMSSNKIWQWDLCFTALFGRYSNGEFPSVVNLENFYRKQHTNGLICREISEDDGKDIYPNNSQPWSPPNPNPPLFAMVEWDYYLTTGDKSHFTKNITSNGTDPGITKTVFQRLVDYFYWVKGNIRHSDGYYTSDYWANGMDDSPRNIIGREGAWMCIETQQAQAAYFIAKIADALGESKIQTDMTAEFTAHKNHVNASMWDAADGIYYDLDKDRKKCRVKTVAAFWPMTTLVADESQASALVKHLTDPDEFWRPNMVPTLAADEPDYNGPTGEYWCGAIWAPTNYATVRGLTNYSYFELAKEVTEIFLRNMYEVYKKTNTVWENYAPEIYGPSLDSYPDFVGWSGVGPITMFIENVLGLRPNAPANTIEWDLLEISRFGIENFRFGTTLIEKMICAKRAHPCHAATITIKTSAPFTLTCIIGEEKKTKTITAGEQTYTFDAGPTINQKPVVSINGPYRGAANAAIQFSSSGTSDIDGTITGYFWNFGDGTTSTDANPKHTFTSKKVYNVSLTVIDNGGKSSVAPTTATITTMGYAASASAKTQYSHIKKIQFGTIDNASGSTGYGDYTNLVADLRKNNAYPLTLTMGSGTAGPDKERFKVWIDWNCDRDFDDAGEMVINKTDVTLVDNGTVSGTVTVPATAVKGKTGLRIILAYQQPNEDPGPYGNFESGEAEDYAVNVVDGSVGIAGNGQPGMEFRVSDCRFNPQSGTTQIVYQLPATECVTIAVYSLNGTLLNLIDRGSQGAGIYRTELAADNNANAVLVYVVRAGKLKSINKVLCLR